MKIIIGISLLLFALCPFFYQISYPQSPTPRDIFRISGINSGAVGTNHYNYITDLGFNTWHVYSGNSSNSSGWSYYGGGYDHLEAVWSQYGDYVKGRIDENYNPNNLYTELDRVKINYLGSGKRSDYQCKSDIHLNGNYYEFAYWTLNSTVSSEIPDAGTYVCYSQVGTNTSGYIAENVRANRDQINSNVSFGPEVDENWYLMPKMKISTNIFNYNNGSTLVCTLKVVKYCEISGMVSYPSIEIFARDFNQDINGYSYSGTYIESYPTVIYDKLRIPSSFFTSYEDDKIESLDFKIYWPGNCDLWIEKLKVENEIAFNLFGDNPNHYYHDKFHNDWLPWEVEGIANQKHDKINNIYFDEFISCQVPCLKYINHKIDSLSPTNHLSLVPILLYGGINTYPVHPNEKGINMYRLHPDMRWDMNAEEIKSIYFDDMGLKVLSFDNYPLDANISQAQVLPNTLPIGNFSYDESLGLLGNSTNNIESYEYNLNDLLDGPSPYNFIGNFKLYSQVIKLCKEQGKDIPLVPILQTHLNSSIDGKLREPTNSELSAMSYIALSYGAKSINYFGYIGYGGSGYNYVGNYSRGLVNPDINGNLEPRGLNVYNEEKWNYMFGLVPKLKNLGNTMLNFDPSYTNSYIYRILSEREALQTNSYIFDVATAKPENGFYPCLLDDPQTPSPGLLYDCPNDRYLQIATFENPNETYPHYFMVVNRRCSPVNSDPEKTGLRYVRVRTKANSFPNPNSWSAVDVETGNTFAFSSNAISYINICNSGDYNTWFQPGEGRLYHIVPTTTVGGTLACNEYIQGGTFNCQDTIFTNGHNLRIGYGTTLNFSDSGCIVVNGGSFICGDISQPTHARDIIFRGNSSNWSGITFENCDTVNINSVQFQNIKGDQNNNNYAVKLINCNLININNCTFTNSDPQTAGAIEANYTNTSDAIPNIYISGNTFTGNSSDKAEISIIANGQSNVPVIIDNNTFTSSSNAATAMYLSFITGTEISGNYISGFNKGIEMHYTSIDVIGNTFLSSSGNNGAKGIDAQDYSVANLSVNGSLQTGGLNIFDNSADNTNNIYVNNASFLLSKGQNQFNIVPNSSSYHLYGYFPGSNGDSQNDETSNCFKLDNVPIVESNLPIQDVKWISDEADVSFNFFSYYCGQNGSEDNLVVDYGNSVFDTIASSPYGESGGVSNTQTVTSKKMYDSLCIAIRLKNYIQAKAKCYYLLNTYPDSVQGLNAVSKLYLLAVSFDTSAVSANECKTFLNTLILNHPNNLPLVRKCNYYIQKCKVRLKEYQSAMTGFQQIIQQNPYTYEALLASWDYSATHLLDSLNGHSGGFSSPRRVSDNEQLLMNNEQSVEELIIPEGSERESFITDYIEKIDSKLFSDDDKDKFTKEERKTISTSIVSALDDSKKKSKNHIETLTKKSEKGDSYAKVELKVMKTINEVVKIKKPKTIFEHINFVNKDIQKLNTVKNETVKKVTNILPTTYSLSQNYPNPFNPVTKINYELPKDGRVKLVIYDILGRQMISLVNNEFKSAGRYTVEFNGTQFASGVYFYRIQVEDGKGFTAVKKMVLVK